MENSTLSTSNTTLPVVTGPISPTLALSSSNKTWSNVARPSFASFAPALVSCVVLIIACCIGQGLLFFFLRAEKTRRSGFCKTASKTFIQAISVLSCMGTIIGKYRKDFFDTFLHWPSRKCTGTTLNPRLIRVIPYFHGAAFFAREHIV